MPTRRHADIAKQRLRNQRISTGAAGGPAQIVSWFGAVQAQEYGPATWALALRMRTGPTATAIERAVDRGQVLRTHVLRPTWHFVTPADIRWMLELTAPHVHRAMTPYRRRLGLDLEVMNRAAAIFERALGDGGHQTRGELGAHLERAGLPGAGARLAHLAMYAELEGVMCSGARRGKQPTYALLAERAPRAERLSRDEAVAELARRFWRSHGPATIRDFVWWSGLRTADAKRGLEVIRARSEEMDGLLYWALTRPASRAAGRHRIHLLPVYDEYLNAYRDRGAQPYLAIANFWHAVVIHGQIAGTWRTTRKSAEVLVDVTLSARPAPPTRHELAAAAERYGRFVDLPVSLSVTAIEP